MDITGLDISATFVLTNLIIFGGSVLSWYIAHIRLKDKVEEMEKDCDSCRKAMNEKILQVDSDVNLDLDEIKSNVKSLSITVNDFKFEMIREFTTLKVLMESFKKAS